MTFKHFIPKYFKLFLKITSRNLNDRISGYYKFFAKTNNKNMEFDFTVSISQKILKNINYENKIHNLLQAISKIDGTIIYPGEIFSFWQIVRNPSYKNGYRISRNIIGGELKEDYGGGLCQLSSIIYHLAIRTGMYIIERHNHSIDIYSEEERFTPLGTDATVVYGYKDLRIQNKFSFPIKISLSIINNQLLCVFSSSFKLIEQEILIHREQKCNNIEVLTYIKSKQENILVSKSVYF